MQYQLYELMLVRVGMDDDGNLSLLCPDDTPNTPAVRKVVLPDGS
jgi:hypothetical protein